MITFWLWSLPPAAFVAGAILLAFIKMAQERRHRSKLPETSHNDVATGATDYSGALAVPDTDPMWRAVHQILDQSEREIVEAAQKMAGVNNDRALNSLSNSEGVAFIRRRLNEARAAALTRAR